jgi:hypothetical protein
MSVGVKVNFFVMTPMTPGTAPNGSIFLDSTNGNALTIKNTNGVIEEVTSSSSTNLFIKQMVASGPIAIKKPVSKRSDGKIQQADSDAAQGQAFVGVSLDSAAADGDVIQVLLVGANIENAISGLGFTPGSEVYLSETGGYTDDPDAFTGDDDSIIKVGIADCAGGIASPTAVDLIIFPEVVVRP